jgi:hypothetical protein
LRAFSQVSAAEAADSVVQRLARFFPGVVQVRIPVNICRIPEDSGSSEQEQTIIEFGTRREVLFACSVPLEFEERITLCNADGSLRTEASVVAVQIAEGKTAVAARFAGEVPNWIIQ